MKKSIRLELEPYQQHLLDEIKRRTGAPVVFTIRRALERYFEQVGEKEGKQEGRHDEHATH
jgi:predicted DNA-binding protein